MICQRGDDMGKASTRAQNKYIQKAYDRINLIVPKGQKVIIQAYADAHGKSVNGFINEAIAEKMVRDREKEASDGSAL